MRFRSKVTQHMRQDRLGSATKNMPELPPTAQSKARAEGYGSRGSAANLSAPRGTLAGRNRGDRRVPGLGRLPLVDRRATSCRRRRALTGVEHSTGRILTQECVPKFIRALPHAWLCGKSGGRTPRLLCQYGPVRFGSDNVIRQEASLIALRRQTTRSLGRDQQIRRNLESLA